ncbi:hypothetical protein H0E84_18565 [Luteimonas sp. SJ-92]|uniref:Uncharacterized protein n=1 Tax=Luteimonas salinisoli TaxID=2752307 RepID=A0A853JG57_9GAMM|nr:hypothetical protein [Luteimonas salinisoli]NZA28383.1 hypothetical protein [Luteimonas salinisoli]
MWTRHLALGALVALAGTFAGCQREPAAEPEPAVAPAPAEESNPAVRPAEPPEEAAATGIATQPGPNGSEVTLKAVRVTGNLVTVELAYRAPSDRALSTIVRLGDVSLIDDATTQRYEVVQDASGRYMAQPLSTSGNAVVLSLSAGDTAQVSFRFPAPPASSPTVSISIPEVGPFDGVPVQR